MTTTETTTTTSARPAAVATEPSWIRSLRREVAAGRHVILHGEIHDVLRWGASYRDLRFVLSQALPELGYDVVGFYSAVDGMRFPAEAMQTSFGTIARPPQSSGGRLPDLRDPRAALGALRTAVQQATVSCAFVAEFSDAMLMDPDAPDRADRDVLMLTKRAMHDAQMAGPRGARVRNLLILIAEDLGQVPEWLYRTDPLVTPVRIDKPSVTERREFLVEALDRFEGGAALTPGDRAAVIDTLSLITEDFGRYELDVLRRLSVSEAMSVATPRPLVNLYRYGERIDHWEQMDMEKIRRAPELLRRRVIGQDAAIEALADRLAGARLGLDLTPDPEVADARPKGVFFFVGPTGVGKTELAKALAHLVFDDEAAMHRFDMSEYVESHSAERFTGAPPGFVGYEAGGQLTNRVLEKPASVFLFDEIEKAHRVIMDKFLQVLEDGRLTDGRGTTAYFGQSFIIFTSNAGSDRLHQRLRSRGELPGYDEVQAIFQEAVVDHFTQTLGRPELLGRLGDGILVFDILREASIEAISRKFLGQLAANAGARLGLGLEVDEASVFELVRHDLIDKGGLAMGGRRIRTVVDSGVRAPLVRWVRDRQPAHGTSVRIWVPPGASAAQVAMV